MKKIMLIINPNSGDQNSEDFENILVDKLKEYFDEVYSMITKKPRDAEKFAKRASEEKYDAICSVGGDGTVNEIIQGIYKQNHLPKLAIIPGGTGNLLSKHLGIAQNKEDAIEEFEFNKTKKIDIGVCNGRCFSLFASIGSVSEAVHEVSSEEKEKFGMLTYVKKSIEKLSENKYFNLKVETDAGSYEGHVDHLLISLSNKLGSLEFTSENKSMSSGKANVLILKGEGLLDRVSQAKSAIEGEIEKNEDVENFIASNIKISSLDESDIKTDIDGEEGPALPVEIEIFQEKVEVYLPR
ncbi:Diacylglycerol kinase family enzyme [Peptoniphilus sp. ING2-D1G]|nr:Diacylglycerol kinase family enzyme [Peptoniphilus sp. ING2-D1G]